MLGCVACVLLTLLVLSWAVTYLVGPGVLYLGHKMEARAAIVPTPIAQFPVEAQQYTRAIAESLLARGFEVRACVSLPSFVPGLVPYVVLLLNPETREHAAITAIFNRDAEPVLKARYVEFCTRFESGVCVETLNPSGLGTSALADGSVKTWLPDVSDPRLLLRMHRHICERAVPDGVALFEDEEEEAFLSRVLSEESEQMQRLGLLSLDQGRGVFQPTYKGACWMCWSQLWPVSSARRARARSTAAQRMIGFKAHVVPSRRSWNSDGSSDGDSSPSRDGED